MRNLGFALIVAVLGRYARRTTLYLTGIDQTLDGVDHEGARWVDQDSLVLHYFWLAEEAERVDVAHAIRMMGGPRAFCGGRQ